MIHRVSVLNQKTKSQVRVVPCRSDFRAEKIDPKKELGTATFLRVDTRPNGQPLMLPFSTFADLFDAKSNELASTDIASLNLLSADSLPNADTPIANYLRILDQWASRIKSETERHFCRFKAAPAEYENSEGYFRMLMMAVVLYEDYGVRYNPERITIPTATSLNDRFFSDSRDIFLHGLLGERRMGTCSSMPVLYVALGRRLGY